MRPSQFLPLEGLDSSDLETVGHVGASLVQLHIEAP